MEDKLLEYFDGDDLAANVWLSKYAMPGETTPDDMHKRMAKEFANIEDKYVKKEKSVDHTNISEYGNSRNRLTYETIYELFKGFKYIIPQGSIMSTLGTDKIASLSNCFVIGQPYDSYGGILQKDEELVQLMKRRGGVGIDISTLRPAGTIVTNAAKSSTGAASFMERYSNSTREVAQGGRRGALMITIDINHPDVLDFINSKKDRTKVTGANISVMLRNEFMEAVVNDTDYFLKFPCDTFGVIGDESKYDYDKLYELTPGCYTKRIRAKKYYDELVNNAWDNAEPGQMFIDKHWSYSPDTVYEQYKGVTTNPCGEIFMQKFDSCRLMCINLYSLVDNPFTNQASINYKKIYELAYEQQRLADDLVDLELIQIDKIINKIRNDKGPDNTKTTELELWNNIRKTCLEGRRTGCGITALGDMLAAMNVPYDSNDAMNIIDRVFNSKMEGELDATIDLSILRGSFTGSDSALEYRLNYENNRTEVIHGNNEFYDMLHSYFDDKLSRMLKYGRRNVSWSTVAPTGTVSLMTQTTSGIEPLFQPYYIRRKKVNPNEPNVKVDFTDQNGDKWQEFAVIHPKFKQWINSNYQTINESSKDELQKAFELSPWYNCTANDINWNSRIELQRIIQKYTTHSISSTINLPNSVTKEEVANIYIQSWKAGLKGVTVYRDGCRTGVLVNDTVHPTNEFKYIDAIKRPKELTAKLHIVSVKGQKYGVVIGLLNNNPYELFAFNLPDNIKQSLTGKLIRVKSGHYNFVSDDVNIPNLQDMAIHNDEQVLTRLVSGMLRHGSSPQFVMEQIDKCDLEIISFGKAISRTLKHYIAEKDLLSRSKCNVCDSTNLKMQEGCLACLDCGNSKCG